MEYYVAIKSKGYSDYVVTLKMYMIEVNQTLRDYS